MAAAGFGTSHGGPVEPAQFAAMPSLHLAWAMWVAIVAFAMLRGKAQRGWVFLYPVMTTVAVIATGNHYVLDVVAGVALALVTCTVFGMISTPVGCPSRPRPSSRPTSTPPPLPSKPEPPVRPRRSERRQFHKRQQRSVGVSLVGAVGVELSAAPAV